MAQQPNVLEFSSLRPIIDGLLFNLERDLLNRTKTADNKSKAHAFVLLRIAVKTIQNAYDAIRFLCADEPRPGQKDNYVLLIPVVNRMLLEVLFTVMFWTDDFPVHCADYQKAGWRQLAEERQKYKTEYSGRPEWSLFFKNFNALLEAGIHELDITQSESKEPATIRYMNTGHSLIERLKAEKRIFARWLNKWFYHEVSSIAHFDAFGVHKIAHLLVSDQAPPGLQVKPEDARRFRDYHLSVTLLIIASVASELEAVFHLKNDDQIKQVWTLLRGVLPDASEMCKRRYDSLLGTDGSNRR